MRSGRYTALALLLALVGCNRLLPLAGVPEAADTSAADQLTVHDRGASEGVPGDLWPSIDLADGPRADLGNPQLKCDTPKAVAYDGTLSLVEPAMRVDKLTLVARQDNSLAWRCSTRSAETATDFGPWQPCQALAGTEDPTFFLRNGQEQTIVAKGDVVPGIRVLQHCSLVPTVSCTTLTVSNLPANIDLDGPDLRAQVGGQEELFFNGVVSGSPGQLYRATATTPAGPWSATEMVGVNMAGYDDGDPAVSDDGVVLIFGSKRPVFLPDNKLNLWVALRVLGSYVMVPSPFQEVFQVAVNSAENEGAPDLVTVDTGSKQILELYFTSDRKVPGVYAIYRAACWLE